MSQVGEVHDLTINISQMSPLQLNFWITKFVGEIGNSSGGRYPPKTLYQIVCGINRDIRNLSGEDGVYMLARSDRREVKGIVLHS